MLVEVLLAPSGTEELTLPVWPKHRAESGIQPDRGILQESLPGGSADERSGRGPAAGPRGQTAGREHSQEPPDQTRHGRPLHGL